MRLRKVRLAGFKSFVEPTTIAFPGELIGVVGPNGCGKSNIIDAVRWVMGELSAKHLRGDTMADVVFAGSSSRKPVGQAVVELIFDNSEGRLGGRYAGYAEISVKRQVSRDSQSVYFLNGTRCRRRDVMDVFLGTGLGPRSYSIIEQGMISRLIEARPEELREFLEEAAGISKYRERRRETENRIRNTRENLARLTDLRDELGKRVIHLKRQATIAERYKTYKNDERAVGAERLALRWSSLDAQATEHQRAVEGQETALEGVLAAQRRAESELEHQRVEHSQATETFNDVYRRVLDAGAEIARAEEMIQGLRQQRQQLGESLERERTNLSGARAHVLEQETELSELTASVEQHEPDLVEVQGLATQSRLDLRQTEEAMHAWQGEWESLTERAAEPAQAAQAEQARIEFLQQNIAALGARISRLEAERGRLAVAPLQREVADLDARLEQEQRSVSELETALPQRRERVRECRLAHQDCSHRLAEASGAVEAARGRADSLLEIQTEALGKRQADTVEWLTAQDLQDCARLAEVLSTDAGWERAAEMVLGFRLQAVCAEGMESLADALSAIEAGELTLIDVASGVGPGSDVGAPFPGDARPTLLDRVRGPTAFNALLGGVLVAETLRDGYRLRDTLAAGQSVVTRDGAWLGRNWIRLVRGPRETGILERERLLEDARREREALEVRVGELDTEQAQSEEALLQAEDVYADSQEQLADRHRRMAELHSELGARRARLEQITTRLGEMKAESADLSSKLSAEERLLQTSRERLQRSSQEVRRLSGERDAWSQRRERHRTELEQAQERWNRARDNAYEVGLRLESMRARLESLERSRARGREQVTDLEARCAEVVAALENTVSPLREGDASLQQRLHRKGEEEARLAQVRQEVETLETQVREREQARHGHHEQVNAERSELESLRLEGQEVLVRRKTLEEQFTELGANANELLQALPEDASEVVWQTKLDDLERRISRLGPINLAAIDEHRELSERKQYLDAQHADLEEALETLQSAIQKLDRETRLRFKETYEKVNAGLGRMFPRLFGGGHANLELTGDDLLSTGVSVMAHPPGKRNASIALLSGGEKALAAIALVFSIFELNPAPFCLLDEVDAPLDDANVVRFCDLVKEMSERVQLVVVTHNKLTMETVQQLIGVTMNEPGVSRLVAVDLDEAVELAAE